VGTSNVIVVGSIFSVLGSAAGITCKADATNFINSGTIGIGYDGLISVTADNLDLTRGTLAMENSGFYGANGLIFFNEGFFDGYWGLGDTETQRPVSYPGGIDPAAYYGAIPPTTPDYIVTNRNYSISIISSGGTNFVSYLLDQTDASGSNRTVRAIFLSNTNPAITGKAYMSSVYPFAMDPDIVEFSLVITNTKAVATNFLYIEDSFLFLTNFQLGLDGFAGVGFNRPTYMPVNYSFFEGGQLFFGTPAVPTAIPPGTFPFAPVTNQWTAYQALFQPGSVVLADVAGQNVTNAPGRIELTANKTLTMPLATVSSVDYVLLKATNQFVGSSGAQISAPYSDIYLRSTNGLLNLTNILVPFVDRPIGVCDLYSARWTNFVANITNRYHVWFVDLQAAPKAPTMVQTLNLWSTNSLTHDDSILISDVFNVMSNLLINTRRLTLTTNALGSSTPCGVLNFLSSSIIWSPATPRLQYLTNYGSFQAVNEVVFGGSQTSPYSAPPTSANPYVAFVNAGTVTNFASTIFATYFQDSGVIYATGGSIKVQQAQTMILTNGALLAPGSAGSIALQGGSLLVSNQVLQAGASLTLLVTNYLDDGSVSNSVDTITNKNGWFAGYGINLTLLPTQASLLGTTITNAAPPAPANLVVPNQWAARDYGPTPRGFVNNAAIGHLILDGNTNNALFRFIPPSGANALYVDLLELSNGTATNFDGNGNSTGLDLQPNFNIYYGDAVWNGRDISEQINGRYGIEGASGGRLLWVSNYNTGFFSSTNVTYMDGSGTHRLNRALVESCDIDSNGNGIPNCEDPNPVPIFSAASLALTAVYTNHPSRAVVVSWNTTALASNYLYASSSPLGKTNQWQMVTNFLSSATVGARVTVTDTLKTNTARYYRVQVVSP
jgi:hypothetical protein